MKPSRMRLLVVADHLGHSGGKRHGGTTYFCSVLPALRRNGINLTTCFQSRRHPAAAELEASAVEPIFLGRRKWDGRALLDIVRLMRESRPHIVHLHTWKSDILGRIAARHLGIPAIVHVHDTAPLQPILGAVQRMLARSTAAMIAVSDAVREFAIDAYSMPPDKVHLIHHGIDLRPYARLTLENGLAIRDQLAIAAGARVVAVIGRIVASKGQLQLIARMANVLRDRRDVVLLVVGEGPQRMACERLAQTACPPGSVRFTGQRLDIPAILSAVDVVAMPSLCEEGFGYSVLEAMAAGRPVVAFRSGGIPALVIDRRTGLLVEKGDFHTLADSIVRLLADEQQRRHFGVGARRHAEQFSLDRHIERVVALYRSVLSAADGRTAPPPAKVNPRSRGRKSEVSFRKPSTVNR